MSAIKIAQIHIHSGMDMDETTIITIVKRKTTSATLSSFAPKSLCCFIILETNPSAKSLTPQYPYSTQKINVNGTMNSKVAAHIRRLTVIMFAKFLIASTSLNNCTELTKNIINGVGNSHEKECGTLAHNYGN